jgi:hypothetical protein
VPAQYVDLLYREQRVAELAKTETVGGPVLTYFWGRLTWVTKQFLLHIRGILIPVGGGESEAELAARLGVGLLPAVLRVLILCLVLGGVVQLLVKDGLSHSLAYLVLYCGVLYIWVWDSVRLLYPIQPFLTVGMVAGVDLVLSRLDRAARSNPQRLDWPRMGVAVFVALLMAASAFKALRPVDSRSVLSDLTYSTTWLQANAPERAIVATQYPELVYLYSSRRTVQIPKLEAPSDLQSYIVDQRIDYLMISPALQWRTDGLRQYDEYTEQTLIPLLRELEAAQHLRLVYTDPQDERIKIYQADRAGQPVQGEPTSQQMELASSL